MRIVCSDSGSISTIATKFWSAWRITLAWEQLKTFELDVLWQETSLQLQQAEQKPRYKLNITQVEVRTKIASEQTVPDKSDLWSDQPRLNCLLIRLSWLRVRLKCARKHSLIRLLFARNSYPNKTSVRSNLPLIRLTCARNSLWSD